MVRYNVIRRWRDRAGKSHQQQLDWPSRPLSRSSPAPDLLDADAEAQLIRWAQAGDDRAANELVRRHVPSVRAEARKRWRSLNPPRKNPDQERAIQFDDFVSAGVDGLRRAIKDWTPGTGSIRSPATTLPAP